jgi:hypothetical protein
MRRVFEPVKALPWVKFVVYREESEPAPVCHIVERHRIHASQQYTINKLFKRSKRMDLKIGLQNY